MPQTFKERLYEHHNTTSWSCCVTCTVLNLHQGKKKKGCALTNMHKHAGSPLAYYASEGHVHTVEQPQINCTPLCTHSSERSACVCKLPPNNSEWHVWRSHTHISTETQKHCSLNIHYTLNIKLASPKLSRSAVCVCVCEGGGKGGVNSRAELDKCASSQQKSDTFTGIYNRLRR